VVLDVEAEAEEDVVPDEHLHLRLLTGVDRHHVPCIQSNNILSRPIYIGIGNILLILPESFDRRPNPLTQLQSGLRIQS
jgi:hypothetical protein